ncbi:c-type cytochrome [Chryseosolibacter indicus]|uniref:C-type cytochrome n=1 Tax=Chryseosolibacter indicus TaxID=2782351 RepID=A0ABS5VWL9_9BACT|nr:c-type cytochrome [Chryseosolibacter indicus]MBT1705230.1 c-type cytochrome [Chryseosolibacter indicus]
MINNYLYSSYKSFILVFLLSLFSFTAFSQDIPSEPAAISAGEQLFNGNCKACHRVNQKLVGPALAGVYDRAPSIDWIKSFIKNSSAVIASGDQYAVNLFNEYNKTQMTAFTSFKDQDIMNILAYIKAEAGKAQAGPDGGGQDGGAPVPPQGGDTAPKYLNIILIGMVIILILLVIILGFLISAIKRFLDQKTLTEEEREVVHSPITAGSITRSPGFIFAVTFIVAALGFKTVINGLYSVGIQQGYAPKQPIAFSHKVHAGQYEIDCKYCHTGVMKWQSATIPSVNICMNCHNQIKSGTNTGEGEIAKIVRAYNENKPIEWVRIHNLPDLAYFNHAQHVNVGGVECQTCHGPIQEMDVVRQHSLLTMGWCIDCHRKTDVNAKGNAYYDKLVELHNKTSKQPMKVEDIGGLECSKCHY